MRFLFRNRSSQRIVAETILRTTSNSESSADHGPMDLSLRGQRPPELLKITSVVHSNRMAKPIPVDTTDGASREYAATFASKLQLWHKLTLVAVIGALGGFCTFCAADFTILRIVAPKSNAQEFVRFWFSDVEQQYTAKKTTISLADLERMFAPDEESNLLQNMTLPEVLNELVGKDGLKTLQGEPNYRTAVEEFEIGQQTLQKYQQTYLELCFLTWLAVRGDAAYRCSLISSLILCSLVLWKTKRNQNH